MVHLVLDFSALLSPALDVSARTEQPPSSMRRAQPRHALSLKEIYCHSFQPKQGKYRNSAHHPTTKSKLSA
jgi:hypothetical protein